ncbi:YhcH/YjgK/YiaL family protein [Mycoplasma hafezii]|uniref:YhcH/YjgK/YiaL family protein n=1 Tax=Mycoplasma hafezii TaxID=525886 RepID=UPI003CE92F3F
MWYNKNILTQKGANMIFDAIKNAKKYKTEYPQINKALQLLSEIDFNSLKDGANIIDENIKIIKRDFWDFYPGEKFGELHDNHVDIHIFGGTTTEKIYFDHDFTYQVEDILGENKETDVVFPRTKEYKSFVILEPNTFALFLPGEFHAPKINDENLTHINKYIIKVKI